ncbi:MAG: HepT-like ribonuclease domain-containing protein [Candidatus Woesearchaeota archaeon]
MEKNKIIDKKLSENLQNAKGIRNIMIHQYEIIDDEKVYDATTKKIEKDFHELVKQIPKKI